MENSPVYLRCRNCGKLIPTDETFGNWYCSKDCALSFTECPVCGNFFETGKGVETFCSPECANTYSTETDQEQDFESVQIKE